MDIYYRSILSLLVIIVTIFAGSSVITEINFINEEYVEIAANASINFSTFYVFDENGKNNTISLYQHNNATLTIIAGSSFYDIYKKLNPSCNYYMTSGSQLSHGGLKSNGESLQISNTSTQFFWNKTEELNFKENQSLHFSNLTQFISNQSICSKSSFAVDLVNTTNQTNTSHQNNTLTCNNTLAIAIQERKITEKIEFEFIVSNNENISIDYWVENYEQEILKNKFTTTNINTKSYTPTKTSPIIIKAQMIQNNCTYINSSETFFYKYDEEKTREEVENKEEDQEKESKLTIKSREIVDTYMKLSLELYRGDTAKRVMNIFVNSKKISSIEIPTKYTKVKSTLLLPLENGDNTIIFQGIELDHELKHFIDPAKVDTTQNNVRQILPSLQFFNISTNTNILQRPFFSSGKILISCTIYNKRSKVSNTFDLEINSGFYIIENTIDENKLNQNITELKQTCKYKDEEKKTFKYETTNFNYTKTQEKVKFKLNISQKQKNTTVDNTTVNLKSSNTLLKEKANLPIMGAMSMLMIGMILMW